MCHRLPCNLQTVENRLFYDTHTHLTRKKRNPTTKTNERSSRGEACFSNTSRSRSLQLHVLVHCQGRSGERVMAVPDTQAPSKRSLRSPVVTTTVEEPPFPSNSTTDHLIFTCMLKLPVTTSWLAARGRNRLAVADNRDTYRF